MISLFPPAKINLGLIIKGKRPDGYHLLETLMVPVQALTDELVLRPAETGCHLQLSGRPLDGSAVDNLCVKAYRALQAQVPDLPGVAIELTKHIPAGAGLGGGSSDAAHVLLGLNQMYELGLSLAELQAIAAPLGADVPFFLSPQPQMATGTGTELEPFDLPGDFRIELRPQPIHSSTVAAYKALDHRLCDPERSLSHLLQQPTSNWPSQLPNDLERPVFGRYPELAAVKEMLYAEGAFYASMSGSGSCMFGLFSTPS
ncbi:MAG: 4-(cytidine 5'-diphospho)-2-C-methyl-D-erythritol kinase [Bacteroidota bacterium]